MGDKSVEGETEVISVLKLLVLKDTCDFSLLFFNVGLLCYLFDTDSTGLHSSCHVCRYFVCWVEFDELYFSYMWKKA